MHFLKQLQRETAGILMFIGYNVASLSKSPGRCRSTRHNKRRGMPSDVYIFQLQFINSLINVMLSRDAALLRWRQMKGDVCPLSRRHTKELFVGMGRGTLASHVEAWRWKQSEPPCGEKVRSFSWKSTQSRGTKFFTRKPGYELAARRFLSDSGEKASDRKRSISLLEPTQVKVISSCWHVIFLPSLWYGSQTTVTNVCNLHLRYSQSGHTWLDGSLSSKSLFVYFC